MLLGVDYYPEQWDSALMEADMDRILELGCNVIRIGEFAWHRMEPEEGRAGEFRQRNCTPGSRR